MRIACACILLLLASSVPAAAPVARLTPEQASLLRQRNALWARMNQELRDANLADAEKACRAVLALDLRLCGSQHVAPASTLRALAMLHEYRGRSAEGAAILERRAAILARLYGPDDHRCGDARRDAADMALRSRWDAEQRRKAKRADQLHQEMMRLHQQGRFASALLLAREIATIRRELHGPNHPRYAAGLSDLAVLHQKMGEHRQALALFQKERRIFEVALGPNHPYLAISLNNLAALHDARGDHQQALPLAMQAWKIRKRIFGENHPASASSLNNLAAIHEAMGNYRQALPVYQRLLAIHDEDHPDRAITLNNLAFLHVGMGDRRQALTLYLQVLKLRRNTLGERHPDLAVSLNNLAGLYQSMGDHERALPLFQESLKIRKEVLGASHPAFAESLNNLAGLYRLMGERRQALTLFHKALEIRGDTLGRRHPAYAESLGNLAARHREMGAHEQALRLLQRARDIQESARGPNHPQHAVSLNQLAFQYLAMDDLARALPLSGRSLALTRSHLDDLSAVQSERQQLDAEQMLRYRLDVFLSCTAGVDMPASVVHDAVLSAKGSVLARQRLRRLLLDESDPETHRLSLALRDASRDLARLALAPFDPRQAHARRTQLEDLTRRKDALEASLSARSETFRRQRTRWTSRQVRDLLPDGVALVDLIAYRHHSPNHADRTRQRVLAFVLRRGSPAARIDLGPAAPIDRAVAEWRKTLGERGTGKEDSGAMLRRLVWQPIEKHLGGAKKVLISPDGSLGGLPFAALPGSKPGTYLLEEVALAVLPVPRILPELLDRKTEKGDPSLLLVGDVDFARGERPLASAESRGAAVDTRLSWPALPGTALEVEAIGRLFTGRFRDASVSRLRGSQASKPAVRQALGKHRWVHLATHGFFAPLEVKSTLDRQPGPEGSFFGRTGVSGWHPMLLSGIVLAGASREAKPGEEDGILTALEISELDLRGCDLAVLSACETGLGQVAGGQGILGLQRAFAVAGARSTMTSLWSVNDAATSVLMEQFYKQLWRSEKVSRVEALRRAQLHVLRNPEAVVSRARQLRAEMAKRGIRPKAGTLPRVEKEVPRSPIAWWAGFVLAGEWR